MDTKNLIKGLHHVTATVGDASEDYDFYTNILGLRLVKQTVNFDNNRVYHFYYGNESGEPGTIMTTFPYKGQQIRQGTPGTGQVAVTGFSIPTDAFEFWKSRLTNFQVEFKQGYRFGQRLLSFKDPAGLELELIGHDQDERQAWTKANISAAHAIRGFYSVTLSVAELKPTIDFMTDVFGFTITQSDGNYTRLYGNDGAFAGNYVDIRHDPDRQRGRNGIGTVHHVAWRLENDEALAAMRHHLVEDLGFKATEFKDRNYFHSIYFRMPGHILFEIATIPPGFTVDETADQLGQTLKLPKWEEKNRSQIEQVLPKFR